MRTLLVAALAAPVVAFAQPSQPSAEAPVAPPLQAESVPAPQPAPPPQYAPPPQPPQGYPPAPQAAPPPQYPQGYPPPPQYAPPPQYPQGYPPPPQYAPAPGPHAPPPQYAPPAQGPAPVPPGYPPPPPGYVYAPAPQVPQPGAPLPPPIVKRQQRDTWYIGFGVGGGDGTLRMSGAPMFGSGDGSFKAYLGRSPSTATINFKVGATLTPRVLLGADITAIRADATVSDYDRALQISTYHAVATYFPVERGVFMRGGLGLARFSYELQSAMIREATNSVSGPSALVGVGYAWWLGRQFNLTANLDFSAQSYRSKDDVLGALPKSSRFWALWLGFDWY